MTERFRYTLVQLHQHLYDDGDRNRLWRLLRDGKQSRHLLSLGLYQETRQALELGLLLHSEAAVDEVTDPRLCWLGLEASRMARENLQSQEGAFDLAESLALDDPERVRGAIDRLRLGTQIQFFLGLIQLIWIEKDRVVQLPFERRTTDDLERLLSAFADEAQMPAVDWSSWVVPSLLVWLAEDCLKIFGPEAKATIESRFLGVLWRMLGASPAESHNCPGQERAFLSNLAGTAFLQFALAAARSIQQEAERNAAVFLLVEAFAETGKLDQGWEICLELEGRDRAEAQAALVVAACKADLLEWAAERVEGIDFPEFLCPSFLVVAVGLARAGDRPRAKHFFCEAASAAVWSRSAETDFARAESAAAQRARGVLEAAWREGFTDEDVWGVVLGGVHGESKWTIAKTFKAVATFLAERRDFDKALEVFCYLEREAGGWWCETISAIGCELLKAHPERREKVLTWCEDMLVTATSTHLRRAEALAAVGDCFLACGKVARAEKIFGQALSEIGPAAYPFQEVEALTILFERLAKAVPFPRRVDLLLQTLRRAARVRSREHLTRELPRLLRAVLEAELADLRLPVIEELALRVSESARADWMDELGEVFQQLCVAGYGELALQLADQLQKRRFLGFALIGEVFAASGDRPRAESVFRQAFIEAKRDPRLQSSPEAMVTSELGNPLLAVVVRAARCGFGPEMLAMLSEINYSALRLLCMSAVCKEIVRLQGSESARRLLREVPSSAPVTYGEILGRLTIVRGLASWAGHNRVETGLESVLQEARRLTGREISKVFEHLSEEQPSTPWGDSSFLLRVEPFRELAVLADAPDRARVLACQMLSKSGNRVGARALAADIGDVVDRSQILAELARAYAERGEAPEAQAIFVEALQCASACREKTRVAQESIVEHLISLDDLDGRNPLLLQALTDAANRDYDSEKAEALQRLLKTLMKAVDVVRFREAVEAGIRLTEKTELSDYVEKLNTAWCRALARCGYIEQALKLARAPRDPRRRWWDPGRALVAVQQGLCERGAWDAASSLLPELDDWNLAAGILELSEQVLRLSSTREEQAARFRLLMDMAQDRLRPSRKEEVFLGLSRESQRAGCFESIRSRVEPFLRQLGEGEDLIEAQRVERFRALTALWLYAGEPEVVLGWLPAKEPKLQNVIFEEVLRCWRESPELKIEADLESAVDRWLDGEVDSVTRTSAQQELLMAFCLRAEGGKCRAIFQDLLVSLRAAALPDSHRRFQLESLAELLPTMLEQLSGTDPLSELVQCAAFLPSPTAQASVLKILAAKVVEHIEDSVAMSALRWPTLSDAGRRDFLLSWIGCLTNLGQEARPRLRRVVASFPFEPALGSAVPLHLIGHVAQSSGGEEAQLAAMVATCEELAPVFGLK